MSNCYRVIVFLFLFIFSVNAQKVDIGLQYNLSFSGPNSIVGIQDQIMYKNEQSISTIRASLGAGNAIEFLSRLSFKDQFALGLQYRFFKSFELVQTNIITNDTHFKSTIQAIQHVIEPSLTFKLPLEKLTFTMVSGLLIPLKTNSQQIAVFKDSISNFKEIQNFTYNFTMGYTASLGIELKLLKDLYLNLALKTSLFNLTLKEKTSSTFFENENDITNNFSSYEKQTIFHEDINNFSNNSSINPEFVMNKPKDELTKNQTFNSVGLTFGLVYRFNKQVKNKK